MSISVRDWPRESRYEIHDSDQLAGFAEYQLAGDTMTFTHTHVDSDFAGRGLGGQLVVGALADVRARGLFVLPVCPFVRDVIAKNPHEYLDLVPVSERERFDLRHPDQTDPSEALRVSEPVEP